MLGFYMGTFLFPQYRGNMLRKGDVIEYDKQQYVVTRINRNGSLSINHAAGSGRKGWAGRISKNETRRVKKIIKTPYHDNFKQLDKDLSDNKINRIEHDAHSRSYYDEKYEIENSNHILDNYVFFPSYHTTVGIWGIKKSTINGKIKGFYQLGYQTREDAEKAASEMPNRIVNHIHNLENNYIIKMASPEQLTAPLPTNDPDGPWFVGISYKNIIADSYDYPHLTDGWQVYVYNHKKRIMFNDYEIYGLNRPLTFKQALKAKEHVLNLTATNTTVKERYLIDKNGEKHLRHKDEPFPTGAIKHSPWNPHDTVF